MRFIYTTIFVLMSLITGVLVGRESVHYYESPIREKTQIYLMPRLDSFSHNIQIENRNPLGNIFPNDCDLERKILEN